MNAKNSAERDHDCSCLAAKGTGSGVAQPVPVPVVSRWRTCAPKPNVRHSQAIVFVWLGGADAPQAQDAQIGHYFGPAPNQPPGHAVIADCEEKPIIFLYAII